MVSFCSFPSQGQIHRVDIVRKAAESDDGCGLYGGTASLVAEGACCRIFDAGSTRAKLDQHEMAGMEKEELWVFQFIPAQPKITEGDFVRVYWGTQPNFVGYSDSIPCGGPPWIILDTEIMAWDTDRWVGPEHTLQYADPNWVLTGEFGYVFDEAYGESFNVATLDWPSLFLAPWQPKFGPWQDYQILRERQNIDLCGRIHHTTVWGELVCSDEPWEDAKTDPNWIDNLFN